MKAVTSLISPVIPPRTGPSNSPDTTVGMGAMLMRIRGIWMEKTWRTMPMATKSPTMTRVRNLSGYESNLRTKKPPLTLGRLASKPRKGGIAISMGGSGRDTAPQGVTFRPGATSHPPALDAQYLLCLCPHYSIRECISLLCGAREAPQRLPGPQRWKRGWGQSSCCPCCPRAGGCLPSQRVLLHL